MFGGEANALELFGGILGRAVVLHLPDESHLYGGLIPAFDIEVAKGIVQPYRSARSEIHALGVRHLGGALYGYFAEQVRRRAEHRQSETEHRQIVSHTLDSSRVCPRASLTMPMNLRA